MKFAGMVKYDLKFGIKRRWKVYILAVLVALWSMRNFDFMYTGSRTMLDYWCFIFQGQIRYYFTRDELFRVPMSWLILFILPSFIIGDYAYSDLNGFGKSLIIKSSSRIKWAVSKLIWCVTSVMLYAGIIALTVYVYAALHGASSAINVEGYSSFLYIDINMSAKDMIVQFVAAPVVTLVSVCVIQMTMTMFVEPIVAYVIILSYDVLSAYITAPVFLGNYSMMLRNNNIYSDGLNFEHGFYVMGAFMAVAITAYILRLRKKDII